MQEPTQASRASRWADRWAFTVLVLREAGRSFQSNRSLDSAATLACYGFLSLMPLLLLVIFVLGLVVRSSDAALSGLTEVMGDLVPTFNAALLTELTALAQSKAWGAVGVVALLWSMTPFAAAARGALQRTFGGERRLTFIKAKLVDIAAVLALLLLFVGLVVARLYVGHAGATAWPVAMLRGAAALAATTCVLAFFYVSLAPIRLRRGELLAGALAAAVLLALMRPLFGLVLQYNPNYGYAFGSLKAIFLLIVWVYYTLAVMLWGAEVSANIRRREALVLRALLAEGRRPDRAARRLRARFVQAWQMDDVLFREGDPGAEMYCVLQGAVRLTRAGRELRVMRAGEYFGEMSMLLQAPRTATATACEPETQVAAISERNFDTILRENPAIVRRLLQEMARRLTAMNERA